MFPDLEKKEHKQNLALDKKYAINRPTFVSGGVQEDQIREIYGFLEASRLAEKVSDDATAGSTAGAIRAAQTRSLIGATPTNGSNTEQGFDFRASRVVRTGPDVAGTNVSTRLWRRVS